MNAFEEGIKSFKTGNIGNPYKKGTRKHSDFEHGFNSAYFSHKEKWVEYERKINEKSEELPASHSESA